MLLWCKRAAKSVWCQTGYAKTHTFQTPSHNTPTKQDRTTTACTYKPDTYSYTMRVLSYSYVTGLLRSRRKQFMKLLFASTVNVWRVCLISNVPESLFPLRFHFLVNLFESSLNSRCIDVSVIQVFGQLLKSRQLHERLAIFGTPAGILRLIE